MTPVFRYPDNVMSERDRETASRPASDNTNLSSTLRSDGPTPFRRSKACERCWTRKQRCDRILPSCTGCARIGVECLARAPPPNPTAGEAVLTQASFDSYLESLEGNARHECNSTSTGDRMEASTQGVSYGHAQSGSTAFSGGPSPANPDSDAASENASSIDDTMGAIGLLTNSAMAEPRPGNRQPPDRLGLLHSVQAALAIDGHDPSTSTSLGSATLFDCRQNLLPTRDDSKMFFHCYLENVYFLPCLAREDVKSLLSCFDTIKSCQVPSAAEDTSHALRSFDTYMQIAIGMMVSPDSIRLSNHAVALQAAAVRLLPAVLRSRRHIDTVHCLILLVAFAMFNPNGGSVWHLVGLALRTCITAGLHKEAGSQSALTSQETEDGRWLFWSVYSLDRWLCVAMDRPFGIQDRDITVQAPGEREDGASFNSGSKEISGVQVIRHAQLISDIRGSGRSDPMFDYSNISYWRDLSSQQRDKSHQFHFPVDQLTCRALLQTVSQTPKPHTNPGILPGTTRDVEDDALASCRRFISASYERTSHGKTAGSFLDAYDMLFAAVVYACLSRRAGMSQSRGRAELMEVLHKASTLVTQISARFPALGDFHRLFLLLSNKLGEDELLGPLHESTPSTTPLRLRRFIEAAFTKA